jgi:pyruvate kinase
VENKDIVFPCEATGSPKPNMIWYKNGDLIDDVQFEHIEVNDDGITIMEVLESDEGIYQCFAKNDGGEIEASAQLNIKGKSVHARGWKNRRALLAGNVLKTAAGNSFE